MKKILLLLSFYMISSTSIFAQESSNPFLGEALIDEEPTRSSIGRIDIDGVRAMEQFSWGIRAFHAGLYNKALLDFENAVRLKPDEPLYRLWLGNANFATGLDDLAVRQWQDVAQNDRVNNGWLLSRIQTLLFRNSPYQDNLDQDTWTVRHEITGRSPRAIRFSGPTDLSSDPLGTQTYVVGYMSNNIAVFDVNGDLRARFNGGIMQLDGPWGVLAMDDGNVFVSEFRGQRVTLLNSNGRRLLTFGDSLEDGNLQGPQYMTSTEDGYLYVSDWVGNKVVKYDFNGKYILTIGLPHDQFQGLRQPSGIAATSNELFVVDTKDKVIHVFDHSGNYLRSFGKGVLEQPEQIKLTDNNRLLIADGRRVLSYNLATNSTIEATNLHNRAGRIVSLDIDRNATIVVADQEHDRVSFLVPRSELYGGFFLNVHQVNSEQFPKVQLITSVQSRSGRAVLGLNEGNFLITENGIELSNIQVQSLDRRSQGTLSSIILIENSKEIQEQETLVLRAIQNLTQSFSNQDDFSIVWATEQPIHNELRNPQEAVLQFHRVFPTLKQFDGRFDRGLRLAGSHLINRNARSAIFYITSGEAADRMGQYSILDLSSYLKNNNITFYPIYLTQGVHSTTYDTIAKETGGQSFYLLRPRGLSEVVEIARSQAAGLYLLSYESIMPSNHGKDYINLAVMSAIQSQSGLTQSGYFPPISVVR